MKKKRKVSALFVDIGGVLLTNGWGRESREKAAARFGLDLVELNGRHHAMFDTYEVGKTSLEEYLNRVIFYKKRPFTPAAFKRFMYGESKPLPGMIELICRLKKKYRLKVAVVSNEGRELNEYRIEKFRLNRFVDFFISSCFVHLRKPDKEIYRLALDVAQTPPSEVVYIEDRAMFVQVAEDLGIPGIRHEDLETTVKKLASFGLNSY